MLNVILGHTQLSLMSIDADHPLFNGLMEIEKAALRSAQLTQQLLSFARKQTISPGKIFLNNLISGYLNLLQRLIGENIQLASIPGHNTWPVYSDSSQIHQILTNLAVNAKDVGKGTGLGLSMVFGIVKQNNVFINVYSEPGIVSTFSIYLPRYMGSETEIIEKEDSIALKSGNETILLVEDEISVKDLAILMLERLGYNVISADTPGEEIKLAEKHMKEISLMMVDVVMPEMTGRELAEHVITFMPDLKVLYMSGYTDDVIAYHGVLDSNINFIQKPFSLNDMSAKIREILDGFL